jgi:hypothetical protein
VNIDLSKIIGPEAISVLTGGNLHKVAAELSRENGIDIGPEMTLEGAVASIGAQAFMKNAELQAIFEGLTSLHELTR